MGIQVELDGTVVHADKVALGARLRFCVKVLGRSLGDDVVHTFDLDIVGVLHIAADGEVVDAATGSVEVSQLMVYFTSPSYMAVSSDDAFLGPL